MAASARLFLVAVHGFVGCLVSVWARNPKLLTRHGISDSVCNGAQHEMCLQVVGIINDHLSVPVRDIGELLHEVAVDLATSWTNALRTSFTFKTGIVVRCMSLATDHIPSLVGVSFESERALEEIYEAVHRLPLSFAVLDFPLDSGFLKGIEGSELLREINDISEAYRCLPGAISCSENSWMFSEGEHGPGFLRKTSKIVHRSRKQLR